MTPVENGRNFDIIDTTLRDGLQSPEIPEHGKYSLAIPERLEIFSALVQYGVRFVEVFSPQVNATERESLARIISMRDELSGDYGYTYILGHVRCDEKDVETAIASGVDGLNLYMGTSKQSQTFNHGKDLSEVASRSKKLIEEVRRNYPHLQLRFSGEDAFRTPMDDLYRVYDGLADSVDRFGMPDTVGTATPVEVQKRVTLMQERYPNVGLEGHFHNDRGFAGINALTAALAGMRYVDTSVLGLAERSGITSQTALLFNLFLEKPELLQGYSLEDSYALNVLVASILEMQVPYTEPISLTNNTHSAGVHTSAMLKNSSVYQAHPLEKFGITETRLLLGPLSGWHVVNYYLVHILNYEGVTPDIAKAIALDFKDECSIRHVKENPTEILNKIAAGYSLQHKNKPKTHLENI